MAEIVITLAITFCLILVTAVLINFCKKRQNRSRHGLTGMCHQSGGAMCSSCNSQLQKKQGKEDSRNYGDILKKNITKE